MRSAPLLKICLLGAVLTLAGAPSSSAHAGERHDARPQWRSPEGHLGRYNFERVRSEWLIECRDRLAGGARLPGPYGDAPGACEDFLEDFYARGPHPAHGPLPWAYPPGYGSLAGCCTGVPMMMVPVMMPPKAEPECTETIEYVYEDVPAAPRIRRAPARQPDKRIRVAPGKRVRIK